MHLLNRILTSAALTAALALPFAAVAQTPAPKTTTPPATTSTPAPKTKTAAAAPTAADIADAKAKGLVWCNKNTKVYHLADSRFYGTTKNGVFMTTADAAKAGYKQAQDNPTGKKKAAASTPATK